jgi:hypothetical protein
MKTVIWDFYGQVKYLSSCRILMPASGQEAPTHFTEPDAPLLCSQEPILDPFLSFINPPQILISYFVKVHFNIVTCLWYVATNNASSRT